VVVVTPGGPRRPSLGRLKHTALATYWLGQYFVVTPVYTILLQAQIGETVSKGLQNTAVGLATFVGGFFAMVVPPVVGHFSDALTTRWGRRRPVIVAGSVGTAIGLLVMFNAYAYPPLLVGFVLVVAFVNMAGAAYIALIPDLVRGGEVGRASGFLGLFVQLGSVTSLVATLVASRSGHLRATYVVIIVVFLLSLLPTLWAAAGEGTTPVRRRPRQGLRQMLSPLWTGDFGWAFFTRFLTIAGLYSVLPFLLFVFRDLFQVPNATTFTSIFELVVTVVAIPLALVCGYLSDRYGRKVFVYAAGCIQAAVLVCFVFIAGAPPWVILALGAAFGVGYGAYSSVDIALGVDTLPDKDEYAKDLGLYHVADALPRVLLPFVMGFLVDALNGISTNLGYRMLSVAGAALFLAGAVMVSRIKSVR
jgi:MFS family permease